MSPRYALHICFSPMLHRFYAPIYVPMSPCHNSVSQNAKCSVFDSNTHLELPQGDINSIMGHESALVTNKFALTYDGVLLANLINLMPRKWMCL